MSVLQTILTLAGLPAHQTCFLQALLSVWLAIPGRLNFRAHPSWFRTHLLAVVEYAKKMFMDTVADQSVTNAPEAARGTPTLGRQGRLRRLCRVDHGARGGK